MYRIELAPGEVTVFRTIDELATGVRNGVITSRARIYHNASQKWLPIEFHPHYKLALELLAGRTIEVPSPKQGDGPLFDALAAPAAPGGSSTAAPSKPALSTPVTSTPVTSASAASLPTVAQLEPAPVDVPASTVMTAPVATATAVARPAELPWLKPAAIEPTEVVASPVLELPTISYPEITPAEEPVAESSADAAGGRRRLHLIAAAFVLVAGAYAARSTFSSAERPAPVAADRPSIPEADSTPARAVTPSVTPTAAPVPTRASAPSPAHSRSPAHAAPAAPAPPASSGFAPALEPRAIVTSPAPKPAAMQDSVKPIDPAPSAVDLSVPTLAGSESLVPLPNQRGDSALKRILRAVSGGKEAAPRP